MNEEIEEKIKRLQAIVDSDKNKYKVFFYVGNQIRVNYIYAHFLRMENGFIMFKNYVEVIEEECGPYIEETTICMFNKDHIAYVEFGGIDPES